MRYNDYIDAVEWDNNLHAKGHDAAGTSAVECEDARCPHYGRNRLLEPGTELRLPHHDG